MQLFGLSAEDLSLLRAMVAWWRGSRIGDNSTDTTRDAQGSPELYVAKTPLSGIPKRQLLRPGQATCEIYKLVPVVTGSTTMRLQLVTNPNGSAFTKIVYNLSATNATAEYVRVSRDKYGMWLADCPYGGSGSGGHSVISFQIISLAPYTDEVSSPCEAVIAEVTSISCQSSDVSVGDEVTIYDPNGCWFNVPVEVLEGASGQAVLMEAGIYDQVPDCVEASGEECWWLVQHLCCTEELYAV